MKKTTIESYHRTLYREPFYIVKVYIIISKLFRFVSLLLLLFFIVFLNLNGKKISFVFEFR